MGYVTFAWESALKGLNIIAQGNALGQRHPTHPEALKGRHTSHSIPHETLNIWYLIFFKEFPMLILKAHFAVMLFLSFDVMHYCFKG